MMYSIKNNILFLGCICFCFFAKAQTFRNKAAIEPVSKRGFYAIPITPQLSGYVKTDFRDLRISDEKGNPVPYIIKSAVPVIKPAEFKPVKIISNETADSGRNSIVIATGSHEKITDLFLKIKNTSVSRAIDLSGSDDGKHWFSVSENIILEKKFITDDDSYMENISFPLSSYPYFRIVIYNGKNDPLNITAIGTYSGEIVQQNAAITDNPPFKFSQKDSNDHFSYITVFNPRALHVGNIAVHLKGPKFFKRNLDVMASHQTVGDFSISSDTVFKFALPVFKDSAFDIRIYNGDNPPLTVTAVATGQEMEKAIAYLEAGVQYSLELTNDSVATPHYDLQGFKDSISLDVPELKLSAIEPIPMMKEKQQTNFFKQAWVWPMLIFVLLILTFFTVRLMKDVENKKK